MTARFQRLPVSLRDTGALFIVLILKALVRIVRGALMQKHLDFVPPSLVGRHESGQQCTRLSQLSLSKITDRKVVKRVFIQRVYAQCLLIGSRCVRIPTRVLIGSC